MTKPADIGVEELTCEDLGEPLTYPVDAFVSREYAAAEGELLWSKVWQMAARVEDVPKVGDFITYNIGDESIVIIRTAPDTLKAYYNVCPHRGRQLVNTPDDVNCVTGRKTTFVCGFHGWAFNREGQNIHVLDKQDWKGALTDERTCLSEVTVDTWGGWIYVNMDPDCEPLRGFPANRPPASSTTSSSTRCATSGASGPSIRATGRRPSRRSWSPTTWRVRIRSC